VPDQQLRTLKFLESCVLKHRKNKREEMARAGELRDNGNEGPRKTGLGSHLHGGVAF
jgi:hypothetical protein